MLTRGLTVAPLECPCKCARGEGEVCTHVCTEGVYSNQCAHMLHTSLCTMQPESVQSQTFPCSRDLAHNTYVDVKNSERANTQALPIGGCSVLPLSPRGDSHPELGDLLFSLTIMCVRCILPVARSSSLHCCIEHCDHSTHHGTLALQCTLRSFPLSAACRC